MFLPKRQVYDFFARPGESLFESEYKKEINKNMTDVVDVDAFNIPINLAKKGINASIAVLKGGMSLFGTVGKFAFEKAMNGVVELQRYRSEQRLKMLGKLGGELSMRS